MKKIWLKDWRKIIFVISIFLSFANLTYAIDGVPAYVDNPQHLVQWLQKDFTYILTTPFSPQSPRETLKSKSGACYDFALLASEILSKIGFDNSIVIVKYKGLSLKHAVCVWQDNDGNYNMISNRKMHYTDQKTIEQAIRQIYHDTERIVVLQGEKRYLALKNTSL